MDPPADATQALAESAFRFIRFTSDLLDDKDTKIHRSRKSGKKDRFDLESISEIYETLENALTVCLTQVQAGSPSQGSQGFKDICESCLALAQQLREATRHHVDRSRLHRKYASTRRTFVRDNFETALRSSMLDDTKVDLLKNSLAKFSVDVASHKQHLISAAVRSDLDERQRMENTFDTIRELATEKLYLLERDPSIGVDMYVSMWKSQERLGKDKEKLANLIPMNFSAPAPELYSLAKFHRKLSNNDLRQYNKMVLDNLKPEALRGHQKCKANVSTLAKVVELRHRQVKKLAKKMVSVSQPAPQHDKPKAVKPGATMCNRMFQTAAEDGSRETNHFTDWLANEEPMCWITGHVGSGKTMLMKSLKDDLRLRTGLQQTCKAETSQQHDILILSSRFYEDAYAEKAVSQDDFFRALLQEALCKRPDWIASCFGARLDAAMQFSPEIAHGREYTLEELRRAMDFVLESQCKAGTIVFMIDGLDRYERAGVEIIRFLHDVSACYHSHAKFVVSGRHAPHTQVAFQQAPDVQMQDITQSAIRDVVKRTLCANKEFKKQSLQDTIEADQLVDTIVRRSMGSFPWALTMVRVVIMKTENAATLNDLIPQLGHTVGNLERLIDEILDQLNPSQAKIFQCLLQADVSSPMSAMEFSYVLEGTEEQIVKLDDASFSQAEMETRCSKVARRLETDTKGLITVSNHETPMDLNVEFVHSIVHGYLKHTERLQKLNSIICAGQAPEESRLGKADTYTALCHGRIAMMKYLRFCINESPNATKARPHRDRLFATFRPMLKYMESAGVSASSELVYIVKELKAIADWIASASGRDSHESKHTEFLHYSSFQKDELRFQGGIYFERLAIAYDFWHYLQDSIPRLRAEHDSNRDERYTKLGNNIAYSLLSSIFEFTLHYEEKGPNWKLIHLLLENGGYSYIDEKDELKPFHQHFDHFVEFMKIHEPPEHTFKLFLKCVKDCNVLWQEETRKRQKTQLQEKFVPWKRRSKYLAEMIFIRNALSRVDARTKHTQHPGPIPHDTQSTPGTTSTGSASAQALPTAFLAQRHSTLSMSKVSRIEDEHPLRKPGRSAHNSFWLLLFGLTKSYFRRSPSLYKQMKLHDRYKPLRLVEKTERTEDGTMTTERVHDPVSRRSRLPRRKDHEIVYDEHKYERYKQWCKEARKERAAQKAKERNERLQACAQRFHPDSRARESKVRPCGNSPDSDDETLSSNTRGDVKEMSKQTPYFGQNGGQPPGNTLNGIAIASTTAADPALATKGVEHTTVANAPSESNGTTVVKASFQPTAQVKTLSATW